MVNRSRLRAGFTLIEIMMAMVLMALIMTSVVALLMSQVRFASQVNADVQALDEVTATQDLLNGEVASLTRGGVLFARGDSLSYRLPLSWGVVCGPVDRHLKQATQTNKKSKTAKAVVYSSTAALALEPTPTAIKGPTPEGFALSGDGANFTYYAVSPWSTMAMTKDTVAALACLRAAPEPAGKSKNVRGRKTNMNTVTTTTLGSVDDYYTTPRLSTVVGDIPDERTLMITYATVNYYFKTDGTGGVSLYRNTAAGTERVAGPFTTAAGFSFRLSTGATATTYSSGNLALIRAIRTNLPALRAKRGTMAADTLNVQPWLYLFNAR